MTKVLRIDGVSGEVVPYFSVGPGEKLGDVIGRLGGSARTETVPGPVPELSEKVGRFIAGYEREEPGSVLAVFWHYGSLEAEEFDSVEQAERYLDLGEEEGTLASAAVVGADGGVTVLP